MLRRRVIALLLCIEVIWIISLANMLVEVVFTEPHEVVTRLYTLDDNQARKIIFPYAFRRKWRIDIIIPPGVEKIGEGKYLLDSARYIVYLDGRYYWMGRKQLVDFAVQDEIERFPIISGLEFTKEESGYTLAKSDEPFFRVIDSIYGNTMFLRRLSGVDYKSGTLFFRRGVVLKVFDWETLLEKQQEVIEEIINAEDTSEYLLFSDGKLMRVR
ncbi:DUF4894 domain-containing protein [Kosmotoga arenicorallina]|nr:DUF4894 domain-containing protein [Kosmotoga arenicorallina]